MSFDNGPLQDLADQIYENAKAHGFWPAEGRNFGEMIALAHSELSEALDEHRSGNPDVYLVHEFECGANSLTEDEMLEIKTPPLFKKTDDGICRVSPYPLTEREADWIASACVCTPKPEGAAVEIADALIRELDTLRSMPRGQLSIDDIVSLKMAYNESRPFKHGRKY